MKKLIFFLVIFTFLISSIVYSETIYPNWGGLNDDFYTDELSKWNSENEDTEVADQFAIDDPYYVPLIKDLNDDGIKEIIVLGDNDLYLLKANITQGNIELFLQDAYSTGQTSETKYFSNIIVYDIDSDGYDEVIFYGIETQHYYIMNWNGTDLYDTGYGMTSPKTSWISAPNEEDSSTVIIGCGDTDGCILLYNDRSTQSAIGTRELRARQFDNTNDSAVNEVILETQSAVPDNPLFCFSRYKSVSYANDKYYYTFSNSATSNQIILASLEVNSTEQLDYDTVINNDFTSDLPNNCDQGMTWYTSPLTMDFTNSVGEEIIYGYTVDLSDNFRMIAYKQDYDKIQNYPFASEADGVLKSNPFKATLDPDSPETSVCVVGYEKNLGDFGTIDILCADEQSGELIPTDNHEFIHEFETQVEYNVSEQNFYTITAHAINTLQNDRSEYLTPYGVFSIEDLSTTSDILFCKNPASGKCDADIIYTMPLATEVAVVPVDYLNEEGKEDLIGFTDVSVFYLDDGYVNQNAYIADCTQIKPSIDATSWALHITSEDEIISLEKIAPDEFDAVHGGITAGNAQFLATNQDGDLIWVQESLNAHNNFTVNMTLDFNGIECLDGELNAYVNYSWNSNVAVDNITTQVYNYTSQSWQNMFILYPTSTSFVFINGTLTTNVTISGFQSNSTDSELPLSFRMFDTHNLVDTSFPASFFQADYFNIECNIIIQDEILSNSSNEVKIKVKAVDPDNNGIVSARAVLYAEDDNEQDTGWSGNYSSGAPININSDTGIKLRPNQTTSNSILRIYVRDSINYFNEPVYKDYQFAVTTDGDYWYESDSCVGQTQEEYEQGFTDCETDSDCEDDQYCDNEGKCITIPPSCTTSGECPEGWVCNNGECEELSELDNNAVTETVATFSLFTGIPVLLLFLIIIAVASWYIFTSETIPPRVKLPSVIIISFFLIAVGVATSMISILWLILMIIAFLAIAGVFVAGYLAVGRG